MPGNHGLQPMISSRRLGRSFRILSWTTLRTPGLRRSCAARRDASVVLEQLVGGGHKSEAKRVVVAFMTLARFDPDERTKRPNDTLGESVFHALGLKRTEMASIAAAAVRCHAQLRRFVGNSTAMAARANTWSATFGKSLYDGWKQRAEIRSHNVLLRGESGTGKEILARAIQLGAIAEHQRDPDAERRWRTSMRLRSRSNSSRASCSPNHPKWRTGASRPARRPDSDLLPLWARHEEP